MRRSLEDEVEDEVLERLTSEVDLGDVELSDTAM